jgi:hypothetical protein
MFVMFAEYKNDLQPVAQDFGNKGTLFTIKRSPTVSCIKYIHILEVIVIKLMVKFQYFSLNC